MIDNLSVQISALSEKYRANGWRLAKPEMDEAYKLYKEALGLGGEGLELCMRFASYLPAESVAKAIAEHPGILLPPLRQKLTERLQKLSEPSGKRFRLSLSVALQKVDQDLARLVLVQACRAFTGTSAHAPGKKVVSAFRGALLDDKAPGLLGFKLQNPLKSEVAPLLTLVVAALYDAPGSATPKFTVLSRPVLEWLFASNLYQFLDEPQKAAISRAHKTWSVDEKRKLADQVSQIPTDLLPQDYLPINQAIEPPGGNAAPASKENNDDAEASSVNQSAPLSADSSSPSQEELIKLEPKRPLQTLEDVVCSPPATEGAVNQEQVPSPRSLLDQLSSAIQSLEQSLLRASKEKEQGEETINDLRIALAESKIDVERIKGDLKKTQTKTLVLEKMRQALEKEVESLRKDEKTLSTEIEDIKLNHQRDLQSLGTRVQIESDRLLEAYKNSLASKLRPELSDFYDVNALPMSLEIGESHRRQLREIFELLAREQIDLKS